MKFTKWALVLLGAVLLTGAGCSRVPNDVVVEINDGESRTQVVEEALPVNETPAEEAEEQEVPAIEEPFEEEPAAPDPAPVQELPEPVEETSQEAPVAEEPVVEEVSVVEAPQPQIRTFDVVMKQWEFVPGTITVNEGDTVRMNVTSTDVDHGIAISAFGVNKTVKAGDTEQIEFIADKKGTYTIFCSVFCGSGHGSMKGTLIVQ